MTLPRILLLTATPPGCAGVGGVFLGDLCLSYAIDSISCVAVTSRENTWIDPALSRLPIMYILPPHHYGVRRFGSLAQLTTLPLNLHAKYVLAPILARRAVRFGKENGAELVWAVLDSPTIIYMARRVASALKVPLVGLVWDPPERYAIDFPLDPLSMRMLFGEFAKVLRSAVRCGVASEGMKNEYSNLYGVDSVVMIRGVPAKLRHEPASEVNRSGKLVIGYAGGIYARREWEALLSALSSVDWRLRGREVSVRVLGSMARESRARGKVRIEYLGWRSAEETVEFMSQVDVAYLPYWFDKRHERQSRLCFPNKLSTYLAAGRPVLYHGPPYASPAEFLRRYPAGICCHSLDKEAILAALETFITEPQLYRHMVEAGQEALDQELNRRVFVGRFARLLGVEDGELLLEGAV